MVSSSTLANEIRTSPAMTKPLSSTRSRTSTRLAVPETTGMRSMLSSSPRTGAFLKGPQTLAARVILLTLQLSCQLIQCESSVSTGIPVEQMTKSALSCASFQEISQGT